MVLLVRALQFQEMMLREDGLIEAWSIGDLGVGEC